VTTTVSAHNVPLVRGLGADETIDRRATRFEDVVRDVDVVFDTVGGETLERSWAVVRPGGKVVTVAADAEGERTQAVRDAFFIVEPRADELAELARLIDGGVIRAMVDATFPLSRARDAYRHRPRHGKAVLEINPAALPGA
jgi:NADPH:quinone reductase-like Zn-dependent oxidoreductase